MFVGGIVIEDDVDGLLHWNRFLDGIEEADELLMAMALHAPADHLTFEHVEGSKERGGTVTPVVMGHGSGAALLHRQAWLGTVERLDLALLIDGQNHGMGRRVDVEADDVAHLGRELRVVRELERANAMRLKPVRAPDALDVGQAHSRDFRHRAAGPVGRFAGRFGQRQSHDPLGHLWAEGLNPRGPGLIAQQPIDALLGKPFLPAPDNRLALGGVAHDRHRAEPVGGGQHDPGAPDVLLWAVAVTTIASRRLRSAAVTSTTIPVRMAQTRTSRAPWESTSGL